MPPEQWSILLYGNMEYESSIQSIIDELLTSTSFTEAINQFSKLKKKPGDLVHYSLGLQDHFEILSRTGQGNNYPQNDTDWKLIICILRSLKEVLQGIPAEHYFL